MLQNKTPLASRTLLPGTIGRGGGHAKGDAVRNMTPRITGEKLDDRRALRAVFEFPKPILVGRQRVGFLESDIDAWINTRIAMRDAGVGAESRRQRAIRAVGGRQ